MFAREGANVTASFHVKSVYTDKVSIESLAQACLRKAAKCERAHDRATESRGPTTSGGRWYRTDRNGV